MELYQLRTFAMVAEEGNLTRAAKRLHASQPAVSAHIKALEDELGVSLFIRSSKGMVLTADGQEMLRHAENILKAAAAMERDAMQMRGVLRGTLRIGINTTPETLRIAELFGKMRAHHADLHLHLLQTMTGEVTAKLEAGELDAGFMFGEITGDKIHALELEQMALVVAGPPGLKTELAGKTPAELGRYPWIGTPANCPLQLVSNGFFRRHGMQPQPAAVIDDESIIRVMVKNGAGLSLMLRQDALAGRQEDRLAIWDKEELVLPLNIACLQRRKNEPMLQTLFSLLSRIWEPVSTGRTATPRL